MRLTHNLAHELGHCTGKRVKVAVIDSGIDRKSASFKNVTKSIGVGYKNDRIFFHRNINDENGHGTKICGIILSIAPDVELYIAKIFEKRLIAEMDCLVKGIEWAIKNKVNVINVSLGTTSTKDIKDLKLVCEEANKNNIIIVSALDNRNKISYPAWFKDVICVYNRKNTVIKKIKRYLLGLNNGYQKYSNSYLVPVVSAKSALLYEDSSSKNIEDVFERLKRW